MEGTDEGTSGNAAADAADAADVVRRFIAARDEAELREVLADDVRMTDWMVPGEEISGADRVIAVLVGPITESFPDVEFVVHDMISDGSSVMVTGEFTGTFTADYWGFPAHGRPVRWTAHDVYRLSGSRIVEIQLGNDTLTVARQLGATIDDERLW